MALNKTVPAIPVPSGVERNVERVLSPIKETLDIWAGRHGNPNDRAVTVRELVDLIQTDATINVTLSTVPHTHAIYLEKAGGVMTGPLELDDTLQFGGAGQTINEIATSLSGSGTNSQLATAAAIEGYADGAITTHTGATDPHADRAYTDTEISSHVSDTDPHGDRAYADSAITTHEGAADPHTGYQLESEKSAANGYASLNASAYVPPGELGSGTPDGTKYLRDDNTWQTVTGGVDTDEKTKVSSNDTTAGYLEDKFVVSAGTNTTNILELSTLNDGADEDRQLQIDEGKIDHDNLTNTHNLSTDIDHAGLTNTHNLSTDIDHNGLTNTHNLTTSIDHDQITNTHNLTTDIDHDQLANFVADEHIDWSVTGVEDVHDDRIPASAVTQHVGSIDHNSLLNTHNLTTSIDHDTITNTHNLTSDIDHSQLSNLTTGDPHTQYQLETEKSSANGYASLDGSGFVPTSELGSGTADSTTYLRGDQTWQTISAGGLFEEDAYDNIYGGTGAGTSLTSSSTNNFLAGFEAGYAVDTGGNNVAIGYYSLRYNQDGSQNIAIGTDALRGHTAVEDDITMNTAVGHQALYTAMNGADNNTALGNRAGSNVHEGNNNTYIGYSAGQGAISPSGPGSYNVAVGAKALLDIDSGDYNVAIGYQTSQYISTGSRNISIGINALAGSYTSSLTGTSNVVLGDNAGAKLNTACSNNVLLGTAAGYGDAGGTSNNASDNFCAGYYAGSKITTCSNNIAIGRNAGHDLTSGGYNILLGYQAGYYMTTGTHSVMIGEEAGYGVSGTPFTSYDTVLVGRRAGYKIAGTSIYASVCIGSYAGQENTGSNNVEIGYSCGQYTTLGSTNVFIGANAGKGVITPTVTTGPNGVTAIGAYAFSNHDGDSTGHVFIGQYAGYSIEGGSNSVGIGYMAFRGTTGADPNQSVAIGYNSLYVGTDCTYSVAIGAEAQRYSQRASYDIFIGHQAGYYYNQDATDSGGNNVVIGAGAGYGSATGENDYSNSVYIGQGAGWAAKTTNYCFGLGQDALRMSTDGSNNTAVGTSCFRNLTTDATFGSYNCAVGASAGRGVSGTTFHARYCTYVGNSAGYSADGSISYNTAVGYGALTKNQGSQCTSLGADSGKNYTGSYNVFVGYATGYGDTSTCTGSNNVFVGNLIGYDFTTATESVAVGNGACRYFTDESYFVAVGYSAGYSGPSPEGVLIGHKAGYYVTTTGNILIGKEAGYWLDQTTAGNGYNTVIGWKSGFGASGNSDYEGCVLVGEEAGYALRGGDFNTIVGTKAGLDLQSGDSNTLLGYLSGENLTSGGSNVLLGQSAGDDLTTESDQLRIANDTGGALVEGDFSEGWVNVNGNFTADNVLPRNYILNGANRVWQRGGTFSFGDTAFGYCFDRGTWYHDVSNGVGNITQETFSPGQTDVPGEPPNYVRAQMTSAQSGATISKLYWCIEGVRTLAGQEATFSVYMKADSSRTIQWGYVQNFGTGGSSNVTNAMPDSFSVTTSWQRFPTTFTMASISGKTIGTNSKLNIYVDLPLNTTYTVDIALLQLEKGNKASPFADVDSQAELQLCRRFYQANYYIYSAYTNAASNNCYTDIYPTPWMAKQPSVTFSSTNQNAVFSSGDPSISNQAANLIRIYKASASGGHGLYYGVVNLAAEI